MQKYIYYIKVSQIEVEKMLYPLSYDQELCLLYTSDAADE